VGEQISLAFEIVHADKVIGKHEGGSGVQRGESLVSIFNIPNLTSLSFHFCIFEGALNQ
jgi:hypothetical protein